MDCGENCIMMKFHSLYSSLNIVRVIKSRMWWAEHVALMGEGEVFKRFWLGGPKGRDHWEDLGISGGGDSIRMELREMGINGANCIWLAQDRVQWWAFVNMVMNLWVK
jgi:hypothetical protein